MLTRKVKIGSLFIGSELPILIQSMTNTKTDDVEKTLLQIRSLHAAGCDIVRVAVPNEKAVTALKILVKEAPLPLIADIHFDYTLAINSIEAGASKVRVNPGNLGSLNRLKEVAKAAEGRAAIRVGVNSGSIPKSYTEKIAANVFTREEAMIKAAKDYVDFLSDNNFRDVVVSLKASDIRTTVNVNRGFRKICDVPLHIGVTEAGTAFSGTIKSAMGIGALLLDGIGETLRVSLTAPPEEEVRVGREILKSLNLREIGPTVISCPTCGRTEIDLYKLATRVENLISDTKENLTIAVMGCAVNGPGEAREADLGIAGGKEEGLIFVKGQIVEKVPEKDLLARFMVHFEEVRGKKAP